MVVLAREIGWIGEKALETQYLAVLHNRNCSSSHSSIWSNSFSLLGGSTLVGSAILGTGEAALEAEGKQVIMMKLLLLALVFLLVF